MNTQFHPANENNPMNYAIYYPDHTEDLPLMIFLHGAGERGLNYDHVNRHAIPMLLQQGREYNAVILCPQCPADSVWDNRVKDLKAIIDKTVDQFNIKPDRICITGGSMGGFGSWMMGLTYPSFFSAIAPVAGGGMSWRTSNLRTTAVKAYHGVQDTVVPIIYSELMVDGVNRSGGKAELIRLEGFAHNDGINYAYSDTDLINWILAQRKDFFEEVPECLSEMF